ncbi:hypothetical protein ACKWTF_007968 [Chironomus riparius]
MRLPKFSLKRCFIILVIFCALLLFVINLREKEIWHNKVLVPTTHHQEHHADKKIENIHDNNNFDHQQPKHVTTQRPQSNEVNLESKINSNNNINEDTVSNDDKKVEIDRDESVYVTRPWYFTNGERYPKPARINKKTNKRLAKLTPSEDSRSDRITNQLMFIPPNYEEIRNSGRLKTILLYNGLGPWNNIKQGRAVFTSSKCPVDTCSITQNRDAAKDADLILYKDHFIPTGVPKHPTQLYMLYFLECPYHTQHIKFPDVFNWTSTYRRDSDIVAPYENWQYFDPKVTYIEQDRNYALNKTKKVAWFVSNCSARNNRLQFAQELGKYIQVDIYGACGNFKCSRSNADKCFEILDRDYKFYLAFENSNCKDYVTEKFFVNGLSRNVLPIVMGARPEDYEMSSPLKSYIHIDEFSSAKELAEYLHILDKNDELYNSYFKWKSTGEFINTYFWCRVCSMLHDEESISQPKWYEDVNEWWRGQGVCTSSSWRKFQARKEVMSDD